MAASLYTRHARGRVAAILGPLAGVATLCAIDLMATTQPAAAKTPGTTYCFNSICHRVLTLQTTAALLGRETEHETSFYDGCKQDVFNPCGLTSSGEVFRPGRADNAASPVYPDGTTLLVFNPETQQAAVVRVNNAGPYWGHRKLDVSRATADKLGFRKKGVAKLRVMVIGVPTETEARYRLRRAYDAVPGPIGQHADLADARRSIGPMMVAGAARYAALRASAITTGALPATPPPAIDSADGAASATEPSWAVAGSATGLAVAGSATGLAVAGSAMIRLPPVAYASSARDPLGDLAPTAPPLADVAVAGDIAPNDHSTGGSRGPGSDDRPISTVAFTPQTPVFSGPALIDAEPPRDGTALSDGAADDASPRSEHDGLFAHAPTAPSTAVDRRIGPALRYTLATPTGLAPTIEVVAARRVDTITGDNQLQPVLGSLPLDSSAEMMDRDLNTGRVTQFSPNTILMRLPAVPVIGRLAMFARSADQDMTISRTVRAGIGGSTSVSSTVKFARMRLTGATDTTAASDPTIAPSR